MDAPRFLRTDEAAHYCGLSPRTLEKLRSIGGGPVFCRPQGRRIVRYRSEDLDGWLLDGIRRSTSDVLTLTAAATSVKREQR